MRRPIIHPEKSQFQRYLQHFHSQQGGLINVYSGTPYQYGGGLSVYSGAPYQYGTGLGDILSSFARSFLRIFGRFALKTGTTFVNKMSDGLDQGKSLKEARLAQLFQHLEP